MGDVILTYGATRKVEEAINKPLVLCETGGFFNCLRGTKCFLKSLFDFNRDGKLDSFEQAAEFAFLSSMTETEADHDELYQAGIDPEDLEYMSAGERREILEDAGLDPDEYDF